MGPEWPSTYWQELKLFLVVYVDDFKLSGPKENLKQGWEFLHKHLQIEDPKPSGHFLGCTVELDDIVLPNGIKARRCVWNMEDFFKSCVERYLSVCEKGTRLKNVTTPFIPEDTKQGPAGAPKHDSKKFVECPYCKHTFDNKKEVTREEIERAEK